MRKLNESNEQELSTCIEQLRDLADEHSIFKDVVNIFLIRVDSFYEKRGALQKLIQMNDNDARKFLEERILATQNFIIANGKKLAKTLIAYSAQSKNNRAARIEDVKAVKDVLKSMEGLTVNYDQLLEEVSRMGDDFNPEDPGLRDVVENLQEIRIATHVDEDSSDEDTQIRLSVTHS